MPKQKSSQGRKCKPPVSCIWKAQLKALFLALLLAISGHQLHKELTTIRLGYIHGKPMSAKQVALAYGKRCRTQFILSGGPVDMAYYAPNVREIRKLLAAYKNTLKYRPEVWDCDDFARKFKSDLQLLWAQQGHVNLPLPIIEVHGIIRGPNGEFLPHAWNAIITDEGKVIYIEPQMPGAIKFHKFWIEVIFYAGL